MSQLNIYLLGSMQTVWGNGRQLRLTRTAQSLLAYLALFQNKSHRRELLADLFWKDQSDRNARRCLSTTLWRMNKELKRELLGESAAFLDTKTMGEIQFSPGANLWIDVAAFERKANLALHTHTAEMDEHEACLLEQAVQLYRGELLEGYYDDWVLLERERLNMLFLRCLSRLMYYHHQQKEWPRSIHYGQRILQIDPFREQIHRELMLLYLENGQRSQAIQQYELCHRLLVEELGIEPLPETQSLYREILNPPATAVPTPQYEAKTLDQILAQIKHAMTELEQAQKQIQQLKQGSS